MPYLPHPHARQRAPRVKFAESTPVVLRSPDGKRSSGKLQVVSVTGGLLNLARPLSQGSMLKLMFLTAVSMAVAGSAGFLAGTEVRAVIEPSDR